MAALHTPQSVLLYGAGGHAAVLADVLAAQGRTVAGLFADEPPARDWGATPYLGPYDPEAYPDLPLILAIGHNAARRDLAVQIRHRFAEGIHPSVLLSPTAGLGEGTVLYHGAIVQAGVQLGRHVIVNTGATIDHDCRIGDFAHIAPGCNLCGGVEVGEGALVGVGAKLIPGVRVGAWATVGAGAVVVQDVPAGQTVVGAPARPR